MRQRAQGDLVHEYQYIAVAGLAPNTVLQGLRQGRADATETGNVPCASYGRPPCSLDLGHRRRGPRPAPDEPGALLAECVAEVIAEEVSNLVETGLAKMET